MHFNFKLFSRLCEKAYNDVKLRNGQCGYEFEDVLYVFRYYFEQYEKHTRRVHPNICMEQIERIIERMPYMDGDYGGNLYDIDPDDYEALIDNYFKTKFQYSDRNINHFFAGAIRDMRYYEEFY